MTLLQFIFALLAKFAPMSEKQRTDLKIEAEEWAEKITRQKKDNDPSRSKIGDLYLKVHESWFVRLVIAVLFIPATAWVTRLVTPELNEVEVDQFGNQIQ